MKYDNYMNIEELMKRFKRWLFSVRCEKDSTTFSSINERQRIVEGVRRFFNENYELRYNVLKQTEEFRRKEPSIAPHHKSHLFREKGHLSGQRNRYGSN